MIVFDIKKKKKVFYYDKVEGLVQISSLCIEH